MRKILQLIVLLIFGATTAFAGQPEKLSDVLTSGKWINYSDGYVPIPTYKEDGTQTEKPKTVKRYKTFSFEEDGAFMLDSAKTRFTGHYRISGDKIV
ncbi:MAG: hypothetical protein ACK5HT_13165, partial [Draconibacterium sp.]